MRSLPSISWKSNVDNLCKSVSGNAREYQKGCSMNWIEELVKTIRLWAQMIDALMQADTPECYTLAFALLDLQPDARYVDTVLR